MTEHPTRREWLAAIRRATWTSSARTFRETAKEISGLMEPDGVLLVLEAQITTKTGLPARTVRHHLKRLAELGWLHHDRKGGRGRRAVYSARIPDPTTGAAPVKTPVEDTNSRQPVASHEAGIAGNPQVSYSAGIAGKLVAGSEEIGRAAGEREAVEPNLPRRATPTSTSRKADRKPNPVEGMLPLPVQVTTRRRPSGEQSTTPPKSTTRPKAADPDPRPAALVSTADALVNQYASSLEHPLGRRSRRQLLTRVDELLEDGFAEEQIRDGFRLLWRNRARCGPGMLPAFVEQAIAAAEMPDNVHQLDRRAQNATAWAQEAAIAAGADPGDPFAAGNFFATTAADSNVIDGEIIRGTA